jgi:hypothetical protein
MQNEGIQMINAVTQIPKRKTVTSLDPVPSKQRELKDEPRKEEKMDQILAKFVDTALQDIEAN